MELSLTTQAASKLKKLLQGRKCEQSGFRFADKQGFCGSGYEHIIDLVAFPEPQDEVFCSQGIPIYIPKESIQRLRGSVIDDVHVDEQLEVLGKQGFSVFNPNIKGPCPCGCNKGFEISN